MKDIQIFKANLKTELLLIISILIVLALFTSLSLKFPSNGWIVLIVLSLSILLYNLLCSRLTEIHVDETNKELILNYRNYFRIIKSTPYNLNEIKFTYKRKATTFRGGIKNICSLYLQDKIIAEVIPDNDGWDDGEIHAFVSKLLGLGIERKFVTI
jgi:hypothetical protein